jgi:hypothetical protein
VSDAAPSSIHSQRQRKPSPPTSFKLKAAIEEIFPTSSATQESREPLEAALVNASFDLSAVSAALERFASAEKEKALHAALTAYPPLLDDHTITLRLDNDLLLTKSKELYANLLAHFKQELKNSQITLQFDLYDEQRDDAPVVKRLYTAQDKLDHFITRYPVVRELCERFGLEVP